MHCVPEGDRVGTVFGFKKLGPNQEGDFRFSEFDGDASHPIPTSLAMPRHTLGARRT